MPIPIWENAESRVATNVCRYLKTWEKEGGYRSRGLRVTKMKLLTSNAASRSRLILEQCIEYIYISNNIYWTIHRIFIEIEFSLVVVDLLLSHLRASRPWRRGRPIPHCYLPTLLPLVFHFVHLLRAITGECRTCIYRAIKFESSSYYDKVRVSGVSFKTSGDFYIRIAYICEYLDELLWIVRGEGGSGRASGVGGATLR